MSVEAKHIRTMRDFHIITIRGATCRATNTTVIIWVSDTVSGRNNPQWIIWLSGIRGIKIKVESILIINMAIRSTVVLCPLNALPPLRITLFQWKSEYRLKMGRLRSGKSGEQQYKSTDEKKTRHTN